MYPERDGSACATTPLLLTAPLKKAKSSNLSFFYSEFFFMNSFLVTEKQRNCMLPVKGFREKFLTRNYPNGSRQFFFIGSQLDYKDLLNRCKFL